MRRHLQARDFPLQVDSDCCLFLEEDVLLDAGLAVIGPDGAWEAALVVDGSAAIQVTLDLAGHRLGLLDGLKRCVVFCRGRGVKLRIVGGALRPSPASALVATQCAAVELEDLQADGFGHIGIRLEDVRETLLRRVTVLGRCGEVHGPSVVGVSCESQPRSGPSGLTVLGLRIRSVKSEYPGGVSIGLLMSGLRRARLAAVEVYAVSASGSASAIEARDCVELILDTAVVVGVTSGDGEAAGLSLAGKGEAILEALSIREVQGLISHASPSMGNLSRVSWSKERTLYPFIRWDGVSASVAFRLPAVDARRIDPRNPFLDCLPGGGQPSMPGLASQQARVVET